MIVVDCNYLFVHYRYIKIRRNTFGDVKNIYFQKSVKKENKNHKSTKKEKYINSITSMKVGTVIRGSKCL